MQLREIMTSKVEVIPPDANISEAAKKMKARDVGAIPVCDGERLCGMITDRDIAVRAIAEGRDPNHTRVRDAMTPEVAYCFEDQDEAEAATVMQQRQIRRLPILNREKRLVGIVSLGDLSLKSGDDALTEETLERVSTPSDRKH